MLVRNGFSGFGSEEDLSNEELYALIDAGERIQKIASGEIFATPEERESALKMVAKFGA